MALSILAAPTLAQVPPKVAPAKKAAPAEATKAAAASPAAQAAPPAATPTAHQAPVLTVAVSPDGTMLATAGRDGTIKLWDLAARSERTVFELPSQAIWSLAFSRDGSLLAAATNEGPARVWNTASGEDVATLQGHSQGIYEVAFSPDGKTLATASGDFSVKLWDTSNWTERATLKGHEKRVLSLAFSPDGTRLATASDDATVRLWDPANGSEAGPPLKTSGGVECVAFSHNGKFLVGGGWKPGEGENKPGEAKVWEAASGQELATLAGHTRFVSGAVFTRDNSRLLTAGFDGSVRTWNTADWKEAASLAAQKSGIWSIAMADADKTLVTAGDDKSVVLWDLAKAQSVASLVPPTGPVVFTIASRRFAGRPTAIQDGKLVLATEPPRQVPLDEILRVELGNTAVLSATWMGQDNHDVVQVGGAAGGNGVQDMHVALSGLPDRKIKQVVAVCRNPQRLGAWRLDTARSTAWRLALERAGNADTAHVYLEPNADNFDQTLQITVTYEDDSTAKLETKITTHTDPQLKVADAAAQPAAADTGPIRVTVQFEGGDRLRGELLSMSKDRLRLRAGWGAEIDIPLLQVLGIQFGSGTSADAAQKFQEHLKKPGAEDVALVLGQDQSVAVVSGRVEALEDGKLRFVFEGEVRSINQPRLAGVVFAAHPPTRKAAAPFQVFQFASGDRLSGRWDAVGPESLALVAAWGGRIEAPSAAVSQIEFRNGKLVSLSDLEPASVEEVPYFGRLMPYRVDRSLLGEPLKMKGKTYARGLAVHSRCVLTYAIDGQFQAFKCTVGFDDIAAGRGRVTCRVLGDNKELFVEKDLRGDQEPKPIDVSVAGVKQLTLEVDFGEAEDTGDRVIWADARLLR